MESDNKYKKLASLAKDLKVLYVEDNAGIQKQAGLIFRKFFKEVIIAQDGAVGLDLFKKHEPDIVITDINMPNMDGLEMLKHIREYDLDTRIIITTGFDDKEKLQSCIELKVDKYLKKPISIESLTIALTEVVTQIVTEKNKKLFDMCVHDAFEYQDTLLIFIQDTEVLIANKKCLHFFEQKNIEEFKEFFKNFSTLLLPHKNFLYNKDGEDWLSMVKKNSGKLFNVKIADSNKENRHFILKVHPVPDKQDMFILSFDDITELNLLQEEGEHQEVAVHDEKEKHTIINFLEVVRRNQSTIRLYNLYKGLSISNSGTIIELSNDLIEIKTTYLQLRAIHISHETVIESELFPTAISCQLKNVNFENQTVTFNHFVFIDTLLSDQKYIRVMPEDNHSISIFVGRDKLNVDMHIIDISIKGVKVAIMGSFGSLEIDDEVTLDMVLESSKIPVIIHTKAKIYALKQQDKEFEMVCLLEETTETKKVLVNYISKRQMALIREFKGLKYAE